MDLKRAVGNPNSDSIQVIRVIATIQISLKYQWIEVLFSLFTSFAIHRQENRNKLTSDYHSLRQSNGVNIRDEDHYTNE